MDRHDATLVAQAVRWPQTQQQRQKLIDRLHKMIATTKDPRALARLAQAVMMAEKQNQEDELNRDKLKRLDSGLPTDAVRLIVDADLVKRLPTH